MFDGFYKWHGLSSQEVSYPSASNTFFTTPFGKKPAEPNTIILRFKYWLRFIK